MYDLIEKIQQPIFLILCYFIIFFFKKSNVVGSLQGHTDRINSIRWLPNSKGKVSNFVYFYSCLFFFLCLLKGGREWWSVQEEELISVSSDKTIRIWRSENVILKQNN